MVLSAQNSSAVKVWKLDCKSAPDLHSPESYLSDLASEMTAVMVGRTATAMDVSGIGRSPILRVGGTDHRRSRPGPRAPRKAVFQKAPVLRIVGHRRYNRQERRRASRGRRLLTVANFFHHRLAEIVNRPASIKRGAADPAN
jgi:hypothetical protein